MHTLPKKNRGYLSLLGEEKQVRGYLAALRANSAAINTAIATGYAGGIVNKQ